MFTYRKELTPFMQRKKVQYFCIKPLLFLWCSRRACSKRSERNSENGMLAYRRASASHTRMGSHAKRGAKAQSPEIKEKHRETRCFGAVEGTCSSSWMLSRQGGKRWVSTFCRGLTSCITKSPRYPPVQVPF